MSKRIQICILLFLFSISFSGCLNRNEILKKKGNHIVTKIENYREENGHLPNNLEVLGIKETLEGPLYYEKVDSINYMVWFGTTLGESMIYYSDTEEWDYRLRGMDKKE